MRPERALDRLDRLLALLPSGVAADARIESSELTTLRFAENVVHQPHAERLEQLSLRVARDGRLATVTTSDLGPGGLRRAIDRALALASAAPRDRRFGGFPGPAGPIRPAAVSIATATLPPEELGRWTERLLGAAAGPAPGHRVAGAVHAGGTTLAVANSSGRRASTRRSVLAARVLAEHAEGAARGSGWSEAAHYDHRRLDPETLGRAAAAIVPDRRPEPVAPGRYRVVLAGSAAATVFFELAGLGFAARAWEDGSSCLRRRRGRRIAPEEMTVVDDGRDRCSLPSAIDAEGTPKRATPLITEGRAEGPVLDLVTAAHLGEEPTGHAWPPEAPSGLVGASPQNIVVAAGAAGSVDELIRETRRGLYVTRFHYVRTVHPGRGVITGMTRDGTYRIERGELAAPVRNLRFTESVLEALRSVELWTRARRCYTGDDERGATAVTAPAMLAGAFRFSSATVF